MKKGKAAPMLVEIIRHTTRPYIAFQYHPEDMDCELATMLINTTIETYDNAKKEKGTTVKEETGKLYIS